MKKLLREPLLHFFLLGAAIFVAYSLTPKGRNNSEPGRIVVTKGQIEHLMTGFAKTWQRPPTEGELKGLVDDWVHEEIATREAIAMGLDKDDTIIRRRLRQKLEFVSDDIAAQTEPTDDDLNGYLKANPERFSIEPQFTFSQVYLNPTKHGDNLAQDTARVLAQLKQADSKTDSSSMGDSILLEHVFQSTPITEIAKQFGETFAAEIGNLKPGQWQGPIMSGYGTHLVLITERTEGRLPALGDVRDAVRREWDNARRLEGNSKFYQELLKRYTVTIEGLEPATGDKKVAETKAK